MIDKPFCAAPATSSGVVAAAAAAWVLISTALANIASGLKPNCHSTMNAMKLAPASSRQALMICTQVVAVMPPNSTYTIMSTPTITTAYP